MRTPDFANLDPPGRPGETIAWCPLCGQVVIRREREDWGSVLQGEEAARKHMLKEHGLAPDVAVAALMEAVKQ